MLGGRAAERLVFDTATSEAENDLQAAVNLARKMVLAWGMSEKLQDLACDGDRRPVFLEEEIAHRRPYSEDTAREIDEQIKLIIHGAAERAWEILGESRAALDRIVEELLVEEEISGERVAELLAESAISGTV